MADGDEPSSGIGKGFVGRTCILVLSAAMLAAAAVTLLAIFQLWPAAGTQAASAKSHYSLLGNDLRVSADVDLLMLAASAGALGGALHTLRSFSWYVGNRTLRWSWVLFYAVLPAVGAIMAIIFYFVLRASLVSAPTGTDVVSPFGVVAISALVGLFSDQAAEKLKNIFETILTKPAEGKDHTGANAPSIHRIDPITGPAGTEVTVTGTGLTAATSVLVGSVAATADVRSDTEIRFAVPPGATTGSVAVTTPHGTAKSDTFTVT